MKKESQLTALEYFSKQYYSVTEDGTIWSHRRSWKPRPTPTKLHTSLNNSGYLVTHFKNKGKVLTLLVHHVVYLFFKGPITVKMEINHINGNKLDNSIKNLEMVTSSENKKHAYRLGLSKPNIMSGLASPVRRPVICLETGQTFITGAEAAKFAGVGSPTMWTALNVPRRTAGGYRFRYVK